jgi:FkbM family methyltransferase
MTRISIIDFCPPIIVRVIKYILRKFNFFGIIKHPFTEVQMLTEVNWIMDIGANVGDVARKALISYPKSKIVCFEPVNNTRDILVKNLVTFNDRIHVFPYALSDSNSTGEINLMSFHGANSILNQSEFHKSSNPHVEFRDVQVTELVCLDNILTQLPSQFYEIVKIDVEGFELNVLKGGEYFFKNCVNTIMIEVSLMRDSNLNDQAFVEMFSLLKSYGFYLYNLYDLCYSINENIPFKVSQFDCVFKKVN